MNTASSPETAPAPSVLARIRLFLKSDRLRAAQILIFALVLSITVIAMNESKLGLLVWGCARAFTALYLGYWADRLLFPYGRPHSIDDPTLRHQASMRRAVLVVGVLIFFGLIP